jgi:hypothetical protein
MVWIIGSISNNTPLLDDTAAALPHSRYPLFRNSRADCAFDATGMIAQRIYPHFRSPCVNESWLDPLLVG